MVTQGPIRVLVCFAVWHEARLFQRRVAHHADVAVRLTGIGRRNAERAIRSFLDEFQPRLVISSGFAGGLAPDLPTGAVIFDKDDDFPLLEPLMTAGARRVRFHCADQIIVSAQEKAQLWRSTRCEAVEMESQVIRQCCRERQIPSATIRVVSDAAGETLPLDFNRCLTSDSKFGYGKLLVSLLSTPGAIPNLIRFQKRLAAAGRTLSDVLCRGLQ